MIIECLIGAACFFTWLDQLSCRPRDVRAILEDTELGCSSCCQNPSTCTVLGGSHPADGEWSATGSCLYFKPYFDNAFFVVSSDNLTGILNGVDKKNNFEYAPGYRIGLSYAFCGCDREVGVTYSNLDCEHHRTVNGNNLFPTIGIERYTLVMANYKGFATSKLGLEYDRTDALLYQRFYDCNNLRLRAVLGFEYANIRADQKIQYVPEDLANNFYTSKVKTDSKFWGVGPEVGIDADYELCRFYRVVPGALSLNFVSTASLLLGQSRDSVKISYTDETNTTNTFDVSQKKTTRVIPAIHANLNINYNFTFCGCNALISAGYEYNTYPRACQQVVNDSYFGSGLLSNQYNTVDMQGFVGTFSLRY